MNSDKVLRWATPAANLGAVVGLILLVLGLKQNETLMRAQTRNDLSIRIVDLFAQVAGNLPRVREFASARFDAGQRFHGGRDLHGPRLSREPFFRYSENINCHSR